MNLVLAPSIKSLSPLSRPIVMLKRHFNMGLSVKKHQHNWGQFLYAHIGVLVVTTPSVRYICPAEQGVWIPNNTSHQVEMLTDCHLSSLYIANSESADLSQQTQIIHVSKLLKLLLVEANKFSDDYDWQGTSGRQFRLIRDLIGTAPKVDTQLPYPISKKLLYISQCLNEQPDNNQTLELWAKEVGASSRTISRAFKSETGFTFSEWRQRLKIQVAIRLLFEGQQVSNIAYDLGYSTVSAFIYMFRKNVGKTPSQFYTE